MTQVIRDMKVKKPQRTKMHRFNILKAVMFLNKKLTVQNNLVIKTVECITYTTSKENCLPRKPLFIR